MVSIDKKKLRQSIIKEIDYYYVQIFNNMKMLRELDGESCEISLYDDIGPDAERRIDISDKEH